MSLQGVLVRGGFCSGNFVRGGFCPSPFCHRLIHLLPQKAKHHFQSGASIPLRPWCISPPVSDFPPVFEIFFDFLENFWNVTFSRQNFLFSSASAKISDDLFFSHQPQISNFPPCFACMTTFPLWFAKISYSPYFSKFPPLFSKNSTAFYILYV